MAEIFDKRKTELKPKKFNFVVPSRSSKYDSSYAEDLYDWMCQGFSFETFSIEGVAHSTIVDWVKSNPEFRHAMLEGQKKRRLIVEAAGLKMLGEGNQTVWKTMVAEYQVTDRVQTHSTEEVTVDVKDSSTPHKLERLARIQKLMEEVKDEHETIDVEIEKDDLEYL